MISIGVYLGGPEQLLIEGLLRASMKAIIKVRGENDESHHLPSVNVVFYVPGSLSSFEDLKEIEAASFSLSKKLLLVAVPVPRKEVGSGGSVKFIINALHKANKIAAETFMRKGITFAFDNVEKIIQKAEKLLLEYDRERNI